MLDEADRMFDLGFIKDIRYMFRRMPDTSAHNDSVTTNECYEVSKVLLLTTKIAKSKQKSRKKQLINIQ